MHIRTIMFATLAGVGLAAAPADGQQVAAKIGYINSDAILAQAPGAEGVRGQIQALQQSFQQRLMPLEDSLNTLLTGYQQQQAMLSPEARQARQQEITAKQQAFQQRAQALEQQMIQERDQLMAPLMERINGVIQNFRTANGYAMILDSSTGIMVSADESLDLTDDILAVLAASAGNGSAPPPNR